MRQQAKMPVCFAVGRTECRLRVHRGSLGASLVNVGSWRAGVVFGQVAMDARSPPYLANLGDVGQRPEWGKKSSPRPRGRASAAGSVTGPWSGHSATGEVRRFRSFA